MVPDHMESEEQDRSEGHRSAEAEIQPREHRTLSKLLPWLVLLMASLALLYFLNRGCAKQKSGEGKMMGSARGTSEDASDTRAVGASDTYRIADAGSLAGKMERAIVAGAVDPNKVYLLDQVGFVDRTATLTPQSSHQLSQLAEVLGIYRDIHVRIEGHTDNTGNVRDNLELSRLRALEVKTFLQDKGIAATRMVVVGRGQYKPISTNDTEAGRNRNHRIELYLFSRE